MGIGFAGLQTNQKRDAGSTGGSGPPFIGDSAVNGVSVDFNDSARIVLGNAVGEPGNPARLTSDREIVTQENVLDPVQKVILHAVGSDIQTELTGSSVIVRGRDGALPVVRAVVADIGTASVEAVAGNNSTARVLLDSGSSGISFLRIKAANGFFDIHSNGTFINFKTALSATTLDFLRVTISNRRVQVGPTLTVLGIIVDFQVSGSIGYRNLIFNRSGTYSVDRDLDSNVINQGVATVYNLPDMTGGNNRNGFIFRYQNNNATSTRVVCAAGQTIKVGNLSTTSGGAITTAENGATVQLIWDNIRWVTHSIMGAWTLS
jgi:hypothetical protein